MYITSSSSHSILYNSPHQTYAHHRIVSLEETVREKNQKVVEMKMTVSRFAQENRILEDRNKVILGHLKHSTPLHSPSKSPLLQVQHADVICMGRLVQLIMSLVSRLCCCKFDVWSNQNRVEENSGDSHSRHHFQEKEKPGDEAS